MPYTCIRCNADSTDVTVLIATATEFVPACAPCLDAWANPPAGITAAAWTNAQAALTHLRVLGATRTVYTNDGERATAFRVG